MATDSRIGSKIPSWINTLTIPGTNVNSGPYIGIVKNNVDSNRSGRVKVFIPDFGGIEEEQAHWVTVQYASPYMGSTRWPGTIKIPKPGENTFDKVNHTYGMWFTPPDIGNFLLITFVGGKINKGYWFACVMPELSHYAIPGIAGSNHLQLPDDLQLSKTLTNPPYPVVEYNDVRGENKELENNFLEIPKPVHAPQMLTLLKQGLEDDKVRGVITSSSQRESPSSVFGISTPGREVEGAKDKNTNAVLSRKGGHTFVMDDGDTDGKYNLVRLRTAGGHQIMMNDTKKVMYIGNSSGSVWMEFTDDGKINVFSQSDINVRSGGTVNLHADKDINMFAKNNISMFAGNDVKVQSQTMSLKATTSLKMFGQDTELSSGSTLKLQAATNGSWKNGGDLTMSTGGRIYLNTDPAPTVIAPPSIIPVEHADARTTMPAPYFKWKHSGAVSSTIPISSPLPSHEPWKGHDADLVQQSASAPSTSPTTTTPPSTTTNPTPTTGPTGAAGKGVSKQASAADLAAQPPNSVGVGSLTAAETTALKAQIAKSESGGAGGYTAVNQLGYLGKYQMGSLALQDAGYIKPGTSNAGMANPANWTGKDGITSKESFLAATDVQEKVMDDNLSRNYKTMTKLGTINSSSSPDDVAGKLSVAHLLGAGGANTWANGGGGNDANGTTGDTYYNRGRYSVAVLAKTATPTA